MEQMTMPWATRATDGLRLRELPAAERPLRRLRSQGAAELSLAELLTALLQPPDAALAHHLLARFGLQGLARATAPELCATSGIGPAGAGRIIAALELGRRLLAKPPAERPCISSPADAARLLLPEMGLLEHEQLRVLLLDSRNGLLAAHTLYVGNLNMAVVRTGEVFREAVRANAARIVVAHNHPSGSTEPSPDDVRVTECLVQAGQLLNIELLDHLVIGGQRYLSLKQQGMGFASPEEGS